MIKSNFILEILDSLFDDDNDSLKLRRQLEYLTDANYNYTGSGLFVKFSHDDNISSIRIDKDNMVLSGVLIKSSELKLGADAMVFITNGIINYIEIHSRCGNYPKRELTDYFLSKIWKESYKKK